MIPQNSVACILILEPYDTGSHAAWLRGYQRLSRHDIALLTLPGQFWQWRMTGGAVTLARQYSRLNAQPDLVVATDMLDLTTFMALTRLNVPTAMYFHENQLTYPTGPRQKPKHEFAFINYASALAADAVFFNSTFHMNAFCDELPRFLKHFPDYNELESVDFLRGKSQVLSVGVDLRRFDAHRVPRSTHEPPLILWNHRWEPDKNPRAFFKALFRLQEAGIPFRVALLGENFSREPLEFEAAREKLGPRVAQYGYAEDFATYARWLWRADVVVSSAFQDFFGISIVEAVYCGAYPILPNRLNYPFLIPREYHQDMLYAEGRIFAALKNYLTQRPPTPPELAAHVAQYDWSVMAPQYDAAFTAVQRTKNP